VYFFDAKQKEKELHHRTITQILAIHQNPLHLCFMNDSLRCNRRHEISHVIKAHCLRIPRGGPIPTLISSCLW